MRNSYISYPVFLIALVVVLLSGVHANAQTEDPKSCAGHALPANLELSRDLVGTLKQIYARSPTFRAQCQRISDAPHLHVSVQLDGVIPSSCRAFTMIRRRQRFIDAQVHMPPQGTTFAELISHEFEHIIEQVEGLNLRELARVKGSGVHEVLRELFETDRAERVGKTVADEVLATRDVRPAAD